MAIPNPMYIDEQALHKPSSIRLLSYGLTTGVQGVIGSTDCAVKALGTPGKSVQVMPGAFNVLARHLGGSYEAYAGKFDVAETSKQIPDTTSSGGRSDLIVLVVKNPYVQGSGEWEVPADPVNGPYAEIEVITGVPSTTWDVLQVEPTWSAITLARIDRPASTGVVNPAHIRDLRSIAELGGTRTVYIENPPAEIPPIAQSSYAQFIPSAAAAPGSDNVHDYLVADTTTKNWPAVASWQVPVPDWAREMDIEFQVFNAQVVTNDVYGQLWLDFGGTSLAPQVYAIDYVQQPGRHVVPYGITVPVPAGLRGRVVTVRSKFRSYFTAPGRLDAKGGTTSKLAINFQRVPDAT